MDNQVKNKTLAGGYNLVPLGYFCSVAMELERVGLRQFSLPFDWIISEDFNKVLYEIENGFEHFLDKNSFCQEYDVNPEYYYNEAAGLHFYHDFNPYKSFDEQYENFEKKYKKRIKRFFEIIKQPTIFIRYCTGEDEITFIKSNEEKINSVLQSFNIANKIIFITDNPGDYRENFFYAEKDERDGVSRKFLRKNPELEKILYRESVLTLKEIDKNKSFLRKKFIKKTFGKIIKKLKRKFNKNTYFYSKQLNK